MVHFAKGKGCSTAPSEERPKRTTIAAQVKDSYTLYDSVYTMLMGDVLSVRLDSELEKKLALLMMKKKIVDKSAYIRQLISRSLTDDLLDYLAGEVMMRRISSWRAAEIAGIPLRSMLGELATRHIETYDEKALEEDISFAEGE